MSGATRFLTTSRQTSSTSAWRPMFTSISRLTAWSYSDSKGLERNMAQTLAQSFYLGPFAVYTSPTGLTDPVTGLPELGGTLHEGDYVEVTASEAAQWNVQFGTKLYAGRYRFVRVGTAATSANLAFGMPVGIAKGTSVAQVVLAAAGSSYTAGNYTVTSSTSDWKGVRQGK